MYCLSDARTPASTRSGISSHWADIERCRWRFYFYHAESTFCGACFEFESKYDRCFSCINCTQIWFAPEQRSFATAVATLSNFLGGALGFLVEPFLVRTASDLPVFLYVEAGIVTLVFVLVLVHYPARPPTPPSITTAASQVSQATAHPTRDFLRGVALAMRRVPFAVLVIAGGVQGGLDTAWTGVIPVMLSAAGYSPQTAGLFAFSSSIAGILAGLLLSRLADTVWRCKLKRIAVVCFVCNIATALWLTLSLPLGPVGALVPANAASVGIAMTLSGLFSSGVQPLVFEFCAELAHPVSGATSGGLYTIISQAAAVVFLFVAGGLGSSWMNVLVVVLTTASTLALLFVREDYHRERIDFKESENVLAVSGYEEDTAREPPAAI
jgi:FLVCR family MFS transporter